MIALQLVAHGDPGTLQIREVPDPRPGSGEVVVAVECCGLNHLDLWTERGALPVPVVLPRVGGCEIAGCVESTGPGMTDWRGGERVAVQSNLFCGECEYCRRHEESQCLNNIMLGVQCDGGFAEKVLVPARALVHLPDTLSYETSAALSLAGSTAMHMLTRRAHIQSGVWVLVIAGASGVGSAAIQIARQLGAHVIATGSTDAKRQLASTLGAEFVLDLAEPNWPATVRRWTAKRGVNLVVEHVGGKVLEQAFQCLARGGSVVTCGATSGREIALDLWPFFVKQLRLIGSYGRDRSDLEATLSWADQGKLKPVIDHVYPLTDAVTAYHRLRDRSVLGKLLVRPRV